MARNSTEALFNALTEYTSKSWDANEWSQFGRDTGTGDILSEHPRLYRSLRFNDPDYPDAIRDVLPQVFTELGESDEERLKVIAEFIPQLIGWAMREAPYRTRKQLFEYLNRLDFSEIPEEWIADFAAHEPQDQFRSPVPTRASNPAAIRPPSPWDLPLPAATTAAAAEPPARGTERSQDTVFVVRGRDPRPFDAIETYLGFLGLKVLTWNHAIKLTGEPQPRTYDIVKAGIQSAAAIVVIFSPDDLARVQEEFSEDEDDRQLKGQARQNVTFEAGMAFMSAPDRTIFVRSSSARMPSDLDGFNWVKLDGTWASREDLLNRLVAAGATAKPMDPNLNHNLAGPFKVT